MTTLWCKATITIIKSMWSMFITWNGRLNQESGPKERLHKARVERASVLMHLLYSIIYP